MCCCVLSLSGVVELRCWIGVFWVAPLFNCVHSKKVLSLSRVFELRCVVLCNACFASVIGYFCVFPNNRDHKARWGKFFPLAKEGCLCRLYSKDMSLFLARPLNFENASPRLRLVGRSPATTCVTRRRNATQDRVPRGEWLEKQITTATATPTCDLTPNE